METTYNKEDLQAHLLLIKPDGYALESIGNEFFYTKQETQRKITIRPYYDEYFPHDVVFRTVSIDVLYYNVEQILHDVYVDNSYVHFNHTLNKSKTFSKNFSGTLSTLEINELCNTKVYDDASFFQIKPMLEQMMTAALNFVEQSQTIQDFYNLGELMDEDDQLNFYNHPASFRMAIIKKLLNVPYDVFLQDEIAIYEQHNLEDLVSFALALKNYLDNM